MQYIDNSKVEILSDIHALRYEPTLLTVSAITTTLDLSSSFLWLLSGSTTGQILKLPGATTLGVGHYYRIFNDSTVTVTIQDSITTGIYSLPANTQAEVILQNNSTAQGTWKIKRFITASDVGALNYGDATGFYYFDEFISADNYSVLEWVGSNSTGTQSADTAYQSGYPGIYRQTISSNASRASIYLGILMLNDGSYTYETVTKVTTLATAVQNFTYQFGLFDTYNSNTTPANGVYFEYVFSTSPYWRCVSINGSTSTVVTTTVLVDINFNKLGWDLNSTASVGRSWSRTSNVVTVTDPGHSIAVGQIVTVSTVTGTNPVPVGNYTVTGIATDTYTFANTATNGSGTLDYGYRILYFYIAGVLVGTIKTNLPENPVRPCYKCIKTLGSTARTFDIDSFLLSGSLNTGR